MAGSVISEYLLSIGWVVDQNSLKKFNDAVEKTEKTVMKLGVAVAAAAAAVSAAVVKISDEFEDLYYASQRLNSSVENITAFDFAVSQMGGDAKQARSALEAVANFMRSYPAGESVIAKLGVQTRDANGELRQTTDIVSDLGKRFGQMPYYLAKVYAQLLGINEQTLQALIRDPDQLKKFEEQSKAIFRSFGIDQQQAAKASHDFMVQLRTLLVVFLALADKVLLRFQPIGEVIMGIVTVVADAIGAADKATGGWSSSLALLFGILLPIGALFGPMGIAIAAVVGLVSALIAGVVTLFQNVGPLKSALSQLVDGFADIVSALKPVMDALAPLVKILGPILVGVLQGLGSAIAILVGGAITTLANMLHTVADAIRLIIDLLTLNWKKAWTDAKTFASDTLKDITGLFTTLGKAISDAFYRLTHHGQAPPSPAGAAAPKSGSRAPVDTTLPPTRPPGGYQGVPGQGGIGGLPGAPNAPRSVRNNNPGNLIDPRTGEFRVFSSPAAGSAAMANQLLRDFTVHGLRTVNDLINDPRWGWSPERGRGNTHAGTMNYIAAVSRALGVSANQQINLSDPRVLQTVMAAMARFESGGRWTSPLGAGLGYAGSGGGGGGNRTVNFNAKTDIQIHGGDARATATAVKTEEERVYGNLLRNLKPAVV